MAEARVNRQWILKSRPEHAIDEAVFDPFFRPEPLVAIAIGFDGFKRFAGEFGEVFVQQFTQPQHLARFDLGQSLVKSSS